MMMRRTFPLIPILIVALASLSISSYVRVPAGGDKHASNPGLQFLDLKPRYGVQGYLGIISNPIGHFHVYFPETSQGTCDGREKTSITSAKHGCLFATNGSPFSYTGETCIGSLVSDGQVKTAENGAPNKSQFGLTTSGDFIIGSLNAHEVKSLGFEQLITGFSAIIVNGSITASKGGQIAPRTAIGVNDKGELMIFQADGIETLFQGLTLYQCAEWMQSLGAVQVLNLDGGGSSVTVFKDKIVSRPHCTDTKEICERPCTTITCVK